MVKRTKKNHMQDRTFAELKESAEQALAYERGAREGYIVTLAHNNESPNGISASKAVSRKSRLRVCRKHEGSSDR